MDELMRRSELASVDLSDVVTGESVPPVTPGDVLLTEFLQPMRLSARQLARDIQVPANRITEIIKGERAITARTAVLLERRLGASAEFWMNLQTAYDLDEARAANRAAA